MRITASVLRGFIRETLLREERGTNALGDVPTAPIKVNRSDTAILKNLQSLIQAPMSGEYDADTENAWDDYIVTNIVNINTINDAPAVNMSEDIRKDWATAAVAITTVNGAKETFTPDIKGMYNFAFLIAPKTVVVSTAAGNEDDSEESIEIPAGAGRRPYDVLSNNAPKVWPEGATLDSARYWTFWIDDVQQNTGNWLNKIQMKNSYDQLRSAVENSNRVEIMGIDETEIDRLDNLYGIYIPDVETLDKIFNKGSSTSAQRSAAVTSHPYMTNQNDTDVWPDVNLNVNTITDWQVQIDGDIADYTSAQMKSKYNEFVDVIEKWDGNPGSEPALYLLGKDAAYEATPNTYYYTIKDIATLNKIIRPST
jgi:hypothetical protein